MYSATISIHLVLGQDTLNHLMQIATHRIEVSSLMVSLLIWIELHLLRMRLKGQ